MAAEKTLRIFVEAGKASFGSSSSGLRGSNVSGASNGDNGSEEADRKQQQADKANFSKLRGATEMLHNTFKSNVPPLNKVFKKMGIEVGMKSILKQSQIFTGVVGSIFQILGALVDVTLAPFLPIIVPAIRKLGSLIPKWQKEMNKFAGSVTDAIMWIIDKWGIVNKVIDKLFGWTGFGGLFKVLAVIVAILMLKKGIGMALKGMWKQGGKMLSFGGKTSKHTAGTIKYTQQTAQQVTQSNRSLRTMAKGMRGKKGIIGLAGLGLAGAAGLFSMMRGKNKSTTVDPDLPKASTVSEVGKVVPSKKVVAEVAQAMPGKPIRKAVTEAINAAPSSRLAKALDAAQGLDMQVRKTWTKTVTATEAMIAEILPPAKIKKVIQPFVGVLEMFDQAVAKPVKKVVTQTIKVASKVGAFVPEGIKAKAVEWKAHGYKSKGHMESELRNVEIKKRLEQPKWKQLGYLSEGEYRSATKTGSTLGDTSNLIPKNTISAEVRRANRIQADIDIEKGGRGAFSQGLDIIKNPTKGISNALGPLTNKQRLAKGGKLAPAGLGMGFEIWDAIEDFKFNKSASDDKWGKGSWQSAVVPATGFVADIVTGALSEVDPSLVLALGLQDLSQVGINKLTGQPAGERTVGGMLYGSAKKAYGNDTKKVLREKQQNVIANLNQPIAGLDYGGGTLHPVGGAALNAQMNNKVEVEVTVKDQSKSKTVSTVNNATYGMQYVGYQDGWDLEVG